MECSSAVTDTCYKFLKDTHSKFTSDETVIPFRELSKVERDDIAEDMQDWETYMYCKEAQARQGTLDDDLPPVRPSGELFAENIIYFKMIDKRLRTMNVTPNIRENSCSNEVRSLVSTFNDIEIRHEESWDVNNTEEEKGDRLEKAKWYKAKGNQAYKEENYEEACKLYSECISCGVDDINIHAYNNRAQANIKLGNMTAAISDLNRVLKADPTNLKALFRRAVCRQERRMYREALKDVESLATHYPENCSWRKLRSGVDKDMSTLRGKSYRLRENVCYPETFQVDESQLPAYAEADEEYLIEIDKNGCMKKCVCNHCTSEDRSNFQSNNRLRIERPKWKPLTFKLLEDKGIIRELNAHSGGDNDSGSKGNVSASKTTKVKHVNSSSTNAVKSDTIILPHNNTNGVTPISKNEDAKKKRHSTRFEEEVTSLCSPSTTTNVFLDDASNRVISCIKLRGLKPHFLERQYGNTLNESKLTDMMNSICKDFNLPHDWDQMSEYLKEMARLKTFATHIKRVDQRTLGDVMNLLNLAVDMELKNANNLIELYKSS